MRLSIVVASIRNALPKETPAGRRKVDLYNFQVDQKEEYQLWASSKKPASTVWKYPKEIVSGRVLASRAATPLV